MGIFLDGLALMLVKNVTSAKQAWELLMKRFGHHRTTETYQDELRRKLRSKEPAPVDKPLNEFLAARELTREEYVQELDGRFDDQDMVLSTHDLMPAAIRVMMAAQDVRITTLTS
eukprot:jgi/Mesvir1/20277/Mv13510-RA.1